MERRPVERVRAARPGSDGRDLRGAKRLVLRAPRPKVSVKVHHQLLGRVVRDTPQGGDDRSGACKLEGAGEANQPLAAELFAERGFARR